MKSRTFCFSLSVTTIAICMSFAGGQKAIDHQQQNGNKSAPKYRVAYRHRTKAQPPILEVHISIDPKHFNRNEMVALARQLNKDFLRAPRVTVVICDEYETAKYSGVVHDLLMGSPALALRGFYEINRVSGKEGISFSTERGKRLNEIEIDLVKMR